MALFGVFDGHGREGHLCARFVADRVPRNLSNFLARKLGFAEALHETMVLTNQELHADDSIDDQLSGTTAIVVLMHGNFCYVANVGDSRAIVSQVFRQNGPKSEGSRRTEGASRPVFRRRRGTRTLLASWRRRSAATRPRTGRTSASA
eukprot:scaffold480_cov257-Pinguiococcus_pyrenoidosus.AAC.7